MPRPARAIDDTAFKVRAKPVCVRAETEIGPK
jgi:hypothetical protein